MGAERQNAPPDLNFDTYDLVKPVEDMVVCAIVSGKEPPFDPSMRQTIMTTKAERMLVDQWRICGFVR